MRDRFPNLMSEYLEIEDRIAEAMEWESEHPNACPITKLAEMFDVPYRVRARNARIRVMRGEHQNSSTGIKGVEPPLMYIIIIF
jgi:hypothetical protein